MDIFVHSDKTKVPTYCRDHVGVTKNASPALEAFSANLHQLMEKKPGVTKTAMAAAADCDPKTIKRILELENEPSLATVSGLAKYFAKSPWQMLHPELGDARPSVAQAIDVIAEALITLDASDCKAVAEALSTLAMASDSKLVRDSVVGMLTAPSAHAAEHPSSRQSAATIAPEMQSEAQRRREAALQEVEVESSKKRRRST